MADPKNTYSIRVGGHPSSDLGKETRIYTDLIAHANSYANNFHANNIFIRRSSGGGGGGGGGGSTTLSDYIIEIAGAAGTGGGGTTILVDTESVPFNYTTNTSSKDEGAVVNFIFLEDTGITGTVLTNSFTITVSANNLIYDADTTTYLSEGDVIEFASTISNLRLVSDGDYWYLSGDNTLTTIAAANTYLTTFFTSNSYVRSTFSSNTYNQSTYSSNAYLQSQLLAFEEGEVSNNYIQSRFTTNTYISSIYASNTYLQDQLASFEEGEVSNNYLQDTLTSYASNNYVGSTFTSNNYTQDTYTSNNYVADKYVANTYAQDAFDPAGTAVAMAIALG